ncbi:MAG TPA: glycosyl hydrolase-related protein, partial [Armatimonadota bacterium]|nr:glycosyl hydrolase-related protein [Armatimonadota bacterium]
FGVESRDLSQEPYGSLERMREDVFWGSGWAAYGDGARGCALLIGSGMQGFAFDADQRVLSHTLLKTITHLRDDWERHETRLREGKGRHIFRYALLPFTGDWRSAGIAQRSLAWRRQVRVVKPHGPAGPAPCSHSWLRVEPDSVILSALHRDGDQHVLRIFETHGVETETSIRLPFEPLSIAETDFNGNEVDREIEVDGATVSTVLRPWEIVTLRVLP